MRNQPGVLVVSASAGTGHLRAGEALRRAFLLSGPEVRAEHVDILELAPRWVRTAYGGGFEFMAMHAPWLWRQLYERTDRPGAPSESRWGPWAKRLLFREFRRLLLSGKWQFCLCTHFLPCQLAAGRPGLPPFGVVITDFTLHRYWVQPGVEHYFVATEALEEDVRQRAPGVRVDTTGIPVGPEFADAPPRAEARRSLGLDADRPVALVMGGGLGIGVEDAVDAALVAEVPDLQIVAICGRNEQVHDRLRARRLPERRLRVFGFVTGIEGFLAAADLVITKPGGLTTSEALAIGRPLLLTRPIPGQEEGNIQTLTAAGAAIAAPEPAALTRAVERIFTDPEVLERLSTAAREIGRPRAAETIARTVRRNYLLRHAA